MCSICGFSCADKIVAAQAENRANHEEASQSLPSPFWICFFFFSPCDSGGTTGFSVYDTRCHVVFSDSKAKLRVVSDVRKARMPFFFCFPWELSLRDEKSARKTWTSDGMT